MRKAFSHLSDIMNCGNLTKGYKLFFKSTVFTNNYEDTAETISKQLDTLFEEVAAFETQVLEKWNL